MTTQKQVRARTRNWNKAQVKCIEAKAMEILRGKEMYEFERLALDQIIRDCKILLHSWEPKPPILKEEEQDGKDTKICKGSDQCSG